MTVLEFGLALVWVCWVCVGVGVGQWAGHRVLRQTGTDAGDLSVMCV